MDLKRFQEYVVVIIFTLILIVSMGIVAGIRNGSDSSYTSIDVDSLDGIVKVYRDEFGVPTIVGDSLSDILFAQGFEFARDRSFQLEFYRSLINGEIASLFGKDFIETDKVLRTVGLKRSADRMLDKLTGEEVSLIQSYVDGINKYYEFHPNNKPYELEILGAELHPWEVTDTIAMGSIVAFTFAFGGLNDEISLVKTVEKVGMEKALELHPVDYQPAYDYLSNISEIYYPNQNRDTTRLIQSNQLQKDNILNALEPLFGRAHVELIQGFMSNNWVVSGEKSATGNPMLANDPHTSLEAQGLWHRINLMTRDGSINLQGFTFPGTPLISFGHNSRVAWGVTSGVLDAVDLYYLKMNETHYLYNATEWKQFDTIKTEIDVNGGEPVEYTIRQTELGPILSTELGEYVMQWTLNMDYSRDNPIKALIQFNLADSIDDFHSALEYMLTGFNWVFASTDGNIGYQQSGFIPIRKDGYGIIPKNGSASNQGWNGLIPYEDQLYVKNPPQGYFATANERVDDRELFYISESYASRHRNDRIEEVLTNATDFDADPNQFTIEDMQSLQMDVKTLVATDLLDPILDEFEKYRDQIDDELFISAINKLLSWDKRLEIGSIAGLIFSTYRLFIVDSVLRDELGKLTDTYGKGTRVLSDWYRNTTGVQWFDNITTSQIETAEDMAIITLERTIGYLEKKFGSNINNWTWGDKHRVVLPHTFDSVTKLFNIGGDPVGGSSNTVNAIAGPSWNYGEIDYESSYGPYFRMVFEVENQWNNLWVIVSSGASGNPLSPHYDDAYQEWLNYDYHQWHSSLEYIRENYQLTAEFRRKN